MKSFKLVIVLSLENAGILTRHIILFTHYPFFINAFMNPKPIQISLLKHETSISHYLKKKMLMLYSPDISIIMHRQNMEVSI